MLAPWLPLIIVVTGGTILAMVLGAFGEFWVERRNRTVDRPDDPEPPDPDAALDAILAACRRRTRTAVKQQEVDAIVRGFVAEVAEYRRASGRDPGPAQRYLSDLIAHELEAKQPPSVRTVLAHAQSVLGENA